MKKLLTILWILILLGFAYILFQIFKPESAVNPEIEEAEQVSEETPAIIINEPKSYSEFIQFGDQKINNKDYDAAITAYTNALRQEPKSFSAMVRLGEAYLLNNQPNLAEEAFLNAQELQNNDEIQLALARAYLNQKKVDQAKSLVWTLNRENPEVKFYTAVILILAEDYQGARTLFNEIAKTSSSTFEKAQPFLTAYETFDFYEEAEVLQLQVMLAKALTDVDEHNAAIPVLFDAIKQKSNYRDAWIVLGYAYLNTDEVQEAIDALDQARGLDPEKPETLYFLGLSHFANNDLEKAIVFLERADSAGFQPQDELRLRLADLYLLQQNFELSAQTYEKVLAINKSNPEVFNRTIWIYIERLQNPEKALEVAYSAFEAAPETAKSYSMVGWALAANNQLQEAKSSLEQALKLDPDLDSAFLHLGWLHEKEGSETLAQEYYKKAYSLGRGTPVASLAAVRYNNIQKLKLTIQSP